MATVLGTVQFDTYANYQLQYDLLGQSGTNNESYVRLYGVLNVTGISIGWSSGSATVHTETAGIGTYYGNGSYILIQRDFTFKHDDNGNFSQYIGASINTSYKSGSTGGVLTLPQIQRYPLLNNGQDFTDEENPVYNIISYGLFPIRVKLEAGGDTQLITRDLPATTSGNYELQLTTAERNTLRTLCANSNTLPVVETVCAMDGNTELSASYKPYTMTIVNANPTFTYTVAEQNSKVISLLGSSVNTIVQNASNLRFTVSPSAKKSSTISSVKITHGGITYTKTTSPYTIDVPVTTNSFVITVTDSRGNVSTQTVTKTLIEYQPVDILSLTMKRVNPTSSNIRLNLEAKYYQKTFGSTANVPTVKWKLDNGSFTTIPSSSYTIDTTNNKLTITNYTLSNALVYTSNGTFTIEISDLLVIDTDNRQVLKGVPTYDVGEHDLQVNGDLYIADTTRNNAINVKEEIDNKIPKYELITNGSEVKTGRKIDGQDEYVKRFSASIYDGLQIPHGLTNFKLTGSEAFLDNSYDGAYRPLPSTATSYYVYQITNTNIEYYQSFNLTGNIEVTLYYIKTS